MALYNLGQLRQVCSEYLGMTVVDDTTTPSLTRFNDMINQSVRETMSAFNFRQLETSCRIPFLHTISNVQGAYLSGVSVTPLAGSGISATITPWPTDNLLVNCQVVDNSNYSGFQFVGQDSNGTTYSGVSTEGSGVIGTVSTLGYSYSLPSNVDQIYSVVIPQNSIKLLYIPQYDIERSIPNGILTASGTPAYYTEFDGMSDTNTKSIQFFPQPASNFSGQSFVVHYKKMHVDMTQDTDTQNVLPQQFQDIIIDATLEKIYAMMSDAKSEYHRNRKEVRITDLIVWAAGHLDYVEVERDGNFLGSAPTAHMTQPLFRI